MLGFLINPLSQGLAFLEKNPVGDTAIRDTLGNTVPKTLVTRTPAERADVAISQVGNTVAFVGGGLSVNFLLKKAFEKFQTESAKKLRPTGAQWAVLSRSLGIYSAMASSMWAMPFIRNYITTKRTGMVNYADVIKAGGAPKGPQTPEQKAAVDASLKDSKKKALTILGAGAAGILLPMGLGRIAAEKGLAEKGLNNLFEYDLKKLKIPLLKDKVKNTLLLAEGKFEKLGGLPSMMFWGIPAYIGWYHASRDPYEKKEVFVRCANFVACFSLPPALAKKAFESKLAKEFKAQNLGDKISFTAIQDAVKNGMAPEKVARAKKLLISQNLLGMGSSIVLLGVTPQLLNIYLTKRRLAKEVEVKAAAPENQSSVPAPSIKPPAAASLNLTSGESPQASWLVPAMPVFNAPQAVASMSFPQATYPMQNRYASPWPTAGLGSAVAFR